VAEVCLSGKSNGSTTGLFLEKSNDGMTGHFSGKSNGQCDRLFLGGEPLQCFRSFITCTPWCNRAGRLPPSTKNRAAQLEPFLLLARSA